MINNLGKGLVLAATAASLVFLAWAVAVYTQSVDWGWMDPRKDLGERVPSEIDKRLAALKEAGAFKARAEAGVKDAAASLAVAEKDYPHNVLLYRDKLAEVRDAGGKIKVEGLKYDKGVLVRSAPRATAGPVFDTAVPGAEKSVTGYVAELKQVQGDLDTVTAKLKELTDKEKVLTENLIGKKDEDGKIVKVGMYDLLEREKKTQQQVNAESQYLQPLWVQEMVHAQEVSSRSGQLDRRLTELRKMER